MKKTTTQLITNIIASYSEALWHIKYTKGQTDISFSICDNQVKNILSNNWVRNWYRMPELKHLLVQRIEAKKTHDIIATNYFNQN